MLLPKAAAKDESGAPPTARGVTEIEIDRLTDRRIDR